jgi:hypothetical protein
MMLILNGSINGNGISTADTSVEALVHFYIEQKYEYIAKL